MTRDEVNGPAWGAEACRLTLDAQHGAGHLVVRCAEPGCSSTWYRPRHDSDPG